MNCSYLDEEASLDPLPIVTTLPQLIRRGAHVLDIGAGTGRNTLFLANHGFMVDALDQSPSVVDKLNTHAAARGLPIQAWVHDLRSSTPSFHGYSIIICTFVLHYLRSNDALSLLDVARSQAESGVIHVIGAITNQGDFFREPGAEQCFYPKPKVLEQIYVDAGWEVIHKYEAERPMSQQRPDGSPMCNLVSFIAARK